MSPRSDDAPQQVSDISGTNLQESNKRIVRRVIDEVLNAGRMEAVDELYAPRLVRGARRWINPFRESFPDVHLEIVDLIAAGDKVVGRFRCSGSHLGEWLGHPPTGRRFEDIDEVYIFRIKDGKITAAWGIEDTLKRLNQLQLR